MFETTRDPSDVLRAGTERVVFDLLRAQHGPHAITQRPISARITSPHDQPADYTAGIAAARMVADHANRLVNEYARKARGHGHSWRELAEALGIEPDDEGYTDPAVVAFELVAPQPSMRFDPRRVAWACASCGESITDRGPYEGHPVDNQSGHAANCARHLREVAEYEARAL
jgi:hypothetical protein